MQWTSNKIGILVVMVFTWVPYAGAEEGSSTGGFLRIVNAVGSGERLQVELNGRALHENGYEAGGVTGGIRVPSGMASLSFTVKGMQARRVEQQVQNGETVVLLVHAHWLPGRHAAAGQWVLLVRTLKAFQPERGKVVTVISLSQQQRLQLALGETDRSWGGVTIQSGDMKRHALDWPHGYVPLRLEGERQPSMPVASAANYVVVLHDDGDGGVRLLHFKDRVYGRAK